MTLSKSSPYLFGIAFVLLAFLSLGAAIVRGEVNFNEQTQSENYQTFNFFLATTTTATSTNITGGGGYFKIAGAKKVNLFFQRGDTRGTGNTGTTTFKVQVTPDGSTWIDYNALQKNRTTATGDTYFTRVASVTAGPALNADQAATSTTIYRMDILGFYGVRCIAVETTDGDHTCKGAAEY